MGSDREILKEISKNMQRDILTVVNKYQRQINNSDFNMGDFGIMLKEAAIGMLTMLLSKTKDECLEDHCKEVTDAAKYAHSKIGDNRCPEDPDTIYIPDGLKPPKQQKPSKITGQRFVSSLGDLLKAYCAHPAEGESKEKVGHMLSACELIMGSVLFHLEKKSHRKVLNKVVEDTINSVKEYQDAK